MISKTKINKKMRKKTNTELVETILLAKKRNFEIARLLAVPRRKKLTINLDQIDKQTKEGETMIFPGKILGQGKIEKNIKIIALDFSAQAKDKLKKSKIETKTLKQALEKNANKELHGRVLK